MVSLFLCKDNKKRRDERRKTKDFLLFAKIVAKFAKEPNDTKQPSMNTKLLKEPINLPKIALILGIAYLAFNLCLDMPIHTLLCSELFESFGCTFLRDLPSSMYDMTKYATPLFVLALLIFNTLKQKSTTSKIAVILYGVYVLLSFTLPTLSEPIVGYKYNWWSELYDNNVFICRAITHHILTITPLLQIAALGYFADSNRKNTITFRITIAFILYLFATQAFPAICRFTPLGDIALNYTSLEWSILINKLHVCLIPAVIFAIRNRKNIALCISTLVYILHIFVLGILLMCNVDIAALILNVSLIGIYVAMVILFFKKNFKIEFTDIFILLALTLILCEAPWFESYSTIIKVHRPITMLWTIGLFAAIATDYLSIKLPKMKIVKLAIISSLLSTLPLLYFPRALFGVDPSDDTLLRICNHFYWSHEYYLLSIPAIICFGVYVGAYALNGYALLKLLKLTKEEVAPIENS